MTISTRADWVVVGASFAGLACATAPARAGLAVCDLQSLPWRQADANGSRDRLFPS
jgi:glycine/D-amino acid oxidase-like deaminating enzyme